MNRQIIKNSVHIILVFLALMQDLNGQSKAEVSARVNRDSILIGEPIELILEADIPENSPIRFFPIDTIPHFEFLDRGTIDTTNTSEGTFLRRVILITSFDSGHWVIPQMTIGDGVVTDSIPIDVGYSAFDRNQDYHGIKDILDVEPRKKKARWWWYALSGAILLALAIAIYLLRKKEPAVAVPVVEADPYEEAQMALVKLRSQQIDQKQYYSALVDILRQYLFKRKGILSLQKTTDDLVIQLKSVGLNKDSFDTLAQALRLSDYVKFAKYVPATEDDQNVFDVIKKSIEEIEQIK